jgi:hypothetical protein
MEAMKTSLLATLAKNKEMEDGTMSKARMIQLPSRKCLGSVPIIPIEQAPVCHPVVAFGCF